MSNSTTNNTSDATPALLDEEMETLRTASGASKCVVISAIVSSPNVPAVLTIVLVPIGKLGTPTRYVSKTAAFNFLKQSGAFAAQRREILTVYTLDTHAALRDTYDIYEQVLMKAVTVTETGDVIRVPASITPHHTNVPNATYTTIPLESLPLIGKVVVVNADSPVTTSFTRTFDKALKKVDKARSAETDQKYSNVGCVFQLRRQDGSREDFSVYLRLYSEDKSPDLPKGCDSISTDSPIGEALFNCEESQTQIVCRNNSRFKIISRTRFSGFVPTATSPKPTKDNADDKETTRPADGHMARDANGWGSHPMHDKYDDEATGQERDYEEYPEYIANYGG